MIVDNIVYNVLSSSEHPRPSSIRMGDPWWLKPVNVSVWCARCGRRFDVSVSVEELIRADPNRNLIMLGPYDSIVQMIPSVLEEMQRLREHICTPRSLAGEVNAAAPDNEFYESLALACAKRSR